MMRESIDPDESTLRGGVFPWKTWPIPASKYWFSQYFLTLSIEPEGAASFGAAPSGINERMILENSL